MKRFVFIFTTLIIAAYCVAAMLFIFAIAKAYNANVPHITPQALFDATFLPLLIVLPATFLALIMAMESGHRKSNKTQEKDEIAKPCETNEAAPKKQKEYNETEPLLGKTPDESANKMPDALSDEALPKESSPELKPLEWNLPPSNNALPLEEVPHGKEEFPDEKIRGAPPLEDIVETAAINETTKTSPRSSLEQEMETDNAAIGAEEATKDDAESTVESETASYEAPVTCEEVAEPTATEDEMPASAASETSQDAPNASPDNNSEEMNEAGDTSSSESALEVALSHTLISAASDERDVSLVVADITESQAFARDILKEVFDPYEVFECGDNICAVIKMGMTLDEALTATCTAHERIEQSEGKCFMGISARGIRLIGADTLLLEANEALERAKAENSPIIAFKADADKYRAVLLSENAPNKDAQNT